MDAPVPAPAWPFIHHVGVFVSDFEASRRFYTAALAPLGVSNGYEDGDSGAEYWEAERDTPSVGVDQAPSPDVVTRGMHLAFTAVDRAAVDAFYDAALAAGGTSRHAPRHWPEYGAYCAFVNDPDGNNIEAVHKDAR